MVDSEEAAQDFLDRLDLELDAFEDVTTMQKALDSIFEDSVGVPATSKQVNALFEAGDLSRVKFPNAGIRKIEFVNRGRTQVRFALPFQKGLFGFNKALDLFKNLS